MLTPWLPSVLVVLAACGAIIYNNKRLDDVMKYVKTQLDHFSVDVAAEIRESGDRIVEAIRRK